MKNVLLVIAVKQRSKGNSVSTMNNFEIDHHFNSHFSFHQHGINSMRFDIVQRKIDK